MAFGRERWLMTTLAAAAAAVFAAFVMVVAEGARRGEARAHQQAPASADLLKDRGGGGDGAAKGESD